MNNFLVVVNPDKDENLAVTLKIKETLEAHGAFCRIKKDYDLNINNNLTEEIIGDAECILVLGGDGTLLHVAGETENMDIPLLGINLGTVGFLTECEVSNIESMISRLLSDDFSIEERMMIKGVVNSASGLRYMKRALNDIVITRAGFSRIIGLEVYVDGQVLDTYEADGVVVCTPTGSTGYNLSAGGPIVSPDASLIVITPVSPHSLTAKSIVLSGNEKISIVIAKKRKTQETEAIVSFDGASGMGLSVGDRVDIYKSGKITKLIKMSDINFYEILRNKLGGN